MVADVAAGAALAHAIDPASSVVVAALAAFSLFCGGMALNARVDVEEDRLARPARPLPSGEIGLRQASLLAIVGLGGAPLVVALLPLAHSSPGALWLAGMAVLIGLYHTPARRRPVLGPLILGSIRAANLALGAVLTCGLGTRVAGDLGPVWFAAGCYGSYVLGASLVAHQEDRTPDLRWVRAGMGISSAAVAVAVVLAWTVGTPEIFARSAMLGLAALHGLGLVRAWRLVRGASSVPVEALAGALLSRMSFLPALWALASGHWGLALAALTSLVAVRLLVRWIPPT